MNGWTECRADEVRIEVDMVVGEMASRAGEYARNVYCEQAYGGTEHWMARWLALDVTADAMAARGRTATMSGDNAMAQQFRHYAEALKRALAGEDVMADAVAGRPVDPSHSTRRADDAAPPCASVSALAGRSYSERRNG